MVPTLSSNDLKVAEFLEERGKQLKKKNQDKLALKETKPQCAWAPCPFTCNARAPTTLEAPHHVSPWHKCLRHTGQKTPHTN